MRFISLVAALSIVAATPSVTSARTYAGEEAAALRCANTLALTATALAQAEMIGEPQKELMLSITLLILERHVSGTWAEKKAALAIMRDRRSIEATLDDYRANATRCLRQFPIN